MTNKTDEITASGNKRLANWRFSATQTHLWLIIPIAIGTPPSPSPKTLEANHIISIVLLFNVAFTMTTNNPFAEISAANSP